MSQDVHYQIIWLIRRLFRSLSQKSDEMLRELGITAADRAVLEFLYPDAALSVPEIAKRYDVSRQHVQVTVNPLLEQ
jgi:DNA-binding MarR family transcriptional regulator